MFVSIRDCVAAGIDDCERLLGEQAAQYDWSAAREAIPHIAARLAKIGPEHLEVAAGQARKLLHVRYGASPNAGAMADQAVNSVWPIFASLFGTLLARADEAEALRPDRAEAAKRLLHRVLADGQASEIAAVPGGLSLLLFVESLTGEPILAEQSAPDSAPASHEAERARVASVGTIPLERAVHDLMELVGLAELDFDMRPLQGATVGGYIFVHREGETPLAALLRGLSDMGIEILEQHGRLVLHEKEVSENQPRSRRLIKDLQLLQVSAVPAEQAPPDCRTERVAHEGASSAALEANKIMRRVDVLCGRLYDGLDAANRTIWENDSWLLKMGDEALALNQAYRKTPRVEKWEDGEKHPKADRPTDQTNREARTMMLLALIAARAARIRPGVHRPAREMFTLDGPGHPKGGDTRGQGLEG